MQLTIGPNTFTVNPLGGERSFLLQPKIVPVLSEIAALYALFINTVIDISEGGKNAEADILTLLPRAQPALEAAGPVIERLCAKLGPNLKDIMRELLEGATCDGKMLYTPQGNPIDIIMQGRGMDMWRLLIFAMEVSYPDFFGLLRGFGKKSAEANPSAT